LNNSKGLASLGEIRELAPLGEARKFSLAELESWPLLAKSRDLLCWAELESLPLGEVNGLASLGGAKGFASLCEARELVSLDAVRKFSLAELES